MPHAAKSLGELLRIRNHNQGLLNSIAGALGSALGFAEDGSPCVLVFVGSKVASKWVRQGQVVPSQLSAPDGLSCPVTVVPGRRDPDMSLSARLADGSQVSLPMSRLRERAPLDAGRRELRGYLKGWSQVLLPGSQLAAPSSEGGQREGTLTCLVRHKRRGTLGLLTNEHVAGSPGETLFHPNTHSRAVGRTRQVVKALADERRFPGHVDQPNAYYTVDAAFIDLAPDLRAEDLDARMPCLDAQGQVQLRPLSEPFRLSLEDMEPVGRQVVSVGSNRSFQRGRIVAFAYRWVTSSGNLFYTDYLVVGEAGQTFSGPGDSGKLLAIEGDVLRPVGLLWGGWQGDMQLESRQSRWSYATDLGSALDLLGAELVRG